jgi:hypothetical protein
MEITTISALSAVLGSMVGGSATVATGWITQRTLNKRELVRIEMRRRQMLYGQFIGECAKLMVDAFMHTLEKPETLLTVYALLNRIRLCAGPAVLCEAEKLISRITDQYFAKNLDLDQMRALATAGDGDPLKGFSEACRLELGSVLRDGV